MKLRETLSCGRNIMIGTFLGRMKTLSSPMTFQSDLELSMKCKAFSERSVLLENVLYMLNELGLRTFSSCKGHHSKDGYISFTVSDDQRSFVGNMCIHLLENTGARIIIHPGHYNGGGIEVTICFKSSDRKCVLSTVLNKEAYEKCNNIDMMQELFRLCDLQNMIHDDMQFGLKLSSVADGIHVDTLKKFMLLSLNRNVSLQKLEVICEYMDELVEALNGKVSPLRRIYLMLNRLNNQIINIIRTDKMESRDYYPMFTEKELLEFMSDNGIFPSVLSDLIKKRSSGGLTLTEHMLLREYEDSETLYFHTLKMEESLAAKRGEISLQSPKIML